MFQGSFQDVGDDFHVPVAVQPEARAWLYPVFIDDPQGPKAHVSRIVIRVEGKGVPSIEPVVVGVAPLGSPPHLNLLRFHLRPVGFRGHAKSLPSFGIVEATTAAGEKTPKTTGVFVLRPPNQKPLGPANQLAVDGVYKHMDATHIKTKFEKLGARAKIGQLRRLTANPLVIDIGHDRHGEFFDIQAADDADAEVLDVQPRDRHLLLMVRRPNQRPGLPDIKDKLLCGHDERHWFVAGVPEKAPVSTVVTAKEALKPDLVRSREQGKRGKRSKRLRRKTDVFIRQGEWFFIPAPEVRVNEKLILPHEPIRRGGGKPHMSEQLYRDGGTTVYVCSRHPNGLTGDEYRKLLKQNSDAAKWGWRTMARNPVVYVRGKITHPDHATIRLDGWHRVEMNTENRSRAMASVAFLD